MSALDEAQAVLRSARARRDTRSIYSAQMAVKLAMRDELRADRDRAEAEKRALAAKRADEAAAEARRERSRRPRWWKLWGKRA